MRRHPEFVSFSREHHDPLRLGRHLLAGGGREELARLMPAMLAHFREEERSLLPRLASQGAPELAGRLLREHEALRALFESALRGAHLAEAGQALIDHVRFEERVLFPFLEAQLEAAEP